MSAVLDASVLAELLVASPRGLAAAAQLERHDGELHMPELAVLETASVLRGWVRAAQLSEQRAAAALTDLLDFPARHWPAAPLLPRIWALRQNATVYDASYVALAEALDAELLTADLSLARGLRGIAGCTIVAIS